MHGFAPYNRPAVASPSSRARTRPTSSMLLNVLKSHWLLSAAVAALAMGATFSVALAQGTWSAAQLSEARFGLAAASAGNFAVFAGGTMPLGTLFIPVMSDAVDLYNETGVWSTAQLSVARAYLAAASVRNFVIFAGGLAGEGVASGAVDIYNVLSKTWTATNLSTQRHHLSATSVANVCIFAGGQDAQNLAVASVDIYNSVTDQWSTAQLSLPRWSLAAASTGNVAIFAGGLPSTSGNACSAVDIYNVSSGLWSTSQLSVARFDLVAASVGNLALFAGGQAILSSAICISLMPTTAIYSDAVDLYDCVAMTWSTARLSVSRSSLAAASSGSFAIFAGGSDLDDTLSNVVDIYNSVTGKWSTAQLSVARFDLAAASVGNVFIIAGGFNGTSRSAAVDIYLPLAGTSAPATTSSTPASSLPSPQPFVTTASPSDSQSSDSPVALQPSVIAGICASGLVIILAAVSMIIFRSRLKKAWSRCCTYCLHRDPAQSQLKEKLHTTGEA